MKKQCLYLRFDKSCFFIGITCIQNYIGFTYIIYIFYIKYCDLDLKEKNYRQTSFLKKKNTSQKPGLFWVKLFSNEILTMRAKVRGYVHCIFSDVSQIVGHINLFLIKERKILHEGNVLKKRERVFRQNY